MAGADLLFDALSMASTMNADLMINHFPTAIDALDIQCNEVFPRYGMCVRGILCSLGTGDAGRGWSLAFGMLAAVLDGLEFTTECVFIPVLAPGCDGF